ncbi:C-type lectin domain family 14 member A [Pungitius pungitius]|uniref:C-type lectin domain family 14 member A n=1 Tax=Pungitius pungitius TaxID=134920 RepID=UPI001888157F|nr:C-type lectin domain family 14 member A [Pungitius pungitius]
MESSFCWFYLVIFFRTIWATSPPYTVHQAQVSFAQASENCLPGVLTTLATQQEVRDILDVVSSSATAFGEKFSFWVGLKKVKNECVIPALPLRGFKWTEDGSQESQVIHWAQEPQPTCTAVRCAALKGEWDGSNFTSWGLIPVNCKTNFQFICKLGGGGTRTKLEPTELATPETPKSALPGPPKPVASEATAPQKTAAPEPPKHAIPDKSEPIPSTKQPDTSKPEPGPPSPGHKPETDLKLDTRPEVRSGSCQNPLIPSARSIRLDNSSRIQVECWSSDLVELRCSGQPPVWGLLDGSPANFSTVCAPCGAGFRKDASGFCVDVDECAGAACRRGCLNTPGSFRCFCSNQDGELLDEDSPACGGATVAGVLMPALVAAATLALL